MSRRGSAWLAALPLVRAGLRFTACFRAVFFRAGAFLFLAAMRPFLLCVPGTLPAMGNPPPCPPKTPRAASSSPPTTSPPRPCAGWSRSSSPATAPTTGPVERGVEEKIAQVLAQLRSGEARLVFDPQTETANVAPARDLPQ